MATFTAGTSFTDGVTGDVTAAKLNALVANATPLHNLITDRTAETSVASDDLVLISDTSDSGALNKATCENLFRSTGTGTAASPAIAPSSDTNTGIFFPAADTIAATTNGTERLRIDSSGKLLSNGASNTYGGTGSLSLNAPSGSAVDAELRVANTLVGYMYADATNVQIANAQAGYLSLLTSDTERLRIDSSGNVGIGTTSPSTRLTISGVNTAARGQLSVVGTGDDSRITLYRDSTFTAAFGAGSSDSYIGTESNTPFRILTNNSERLRITSGGDLLVGETSGNYHRLVKNSSSDFATEVRNSSSTTPYGLALTFSSVAPNDATSMYLRCDDTGATGRIQLRSNGGIANYQANNTNLSDERIKKDIINSPSYLNRICSIPVVNFKYKDQTHEDYNLGVIAQQMEQICPELVDSDGFGSTPDDGIPLKAVYQTDLQYALMKCIQELKAENDSLKSRIEALEAA